MMKRPMPIFPPIPITSIVLGFPACQWRLEILRAAINANVKAKQRLFDQAGLPTDVFRHQDGPPPLKPYAIGCDYPFVQYKTQGGYTMVQGFGKAAQAIQLWVLLAKGALTMSGQTMPLGLCHVVNSKWQPALATGLRYYRLASWLPFGANSVAQWHGGDGGRLADLDTALMRHCRHLARGFGFWRDSQRLVAKVHRVVRQARCDWGGAPRVCLDLTMATNLNLPEGIGIGWGAALGHGQALRIPAYEAQYGTCPSHDLSPWHAKA